MIDKETLKRLSRNPYKDAAWVPQEAQNQFNSQQSPKNPSRGVPGGDFCVYPYAVQADLQYAINVDQRINNASH